LVNIYTDGACSGNPGPGGWAMVVIYSDDTFIDYGGEKQTTNNRMELTAIINALQYVYDRCATEWTIYSDSAYCINAINSGWIYNWIQNGWKTSKGDEVKNKDLWQEFMALYRLARPMVKFKKIKGHNGIAGNELADEYARKGIEEHA
jgi:ribonuclease HI